MSLKVLVGLWTWQWWSIPQISLSEPMLRHYGDETLKMHRFKKVLTIKIQSALTVYKPTSFFGYNVFAISTDSGIKYREEENKHKRPFTRQSYQNGLKFRNQTNKVDISREPLLPSPTKSWSLVLLATCDTLENSIRSMVIASGAKIRTHDCGVSREQG